jgi:hypothetical protein
MRLLIVCVPVVSVIIYKCTDGRDEGHGRYWRPDAAPVKEHPLVCQECRERLAAWDQYVGAMRAVLHCLSDRAQQAFFGT